MESKASDQIDAQHGNYDERVSALRAEGQKLATALLDKWKDAESNADSGDLARLVRAPGDPILASEINETSSTTTIRTSATAATLNLENQATPVSFVDTPALSASAKSVAALITSSDRPGVFALSAGLDAAILAVGENAPGIDSITQLPGSHAIVATYVSPFPRAPGVAGAGTAVTANGGAAVGVFASGETAPIQLKLAPAVGAPSAGEHEAGEIMLDSQADMYLCKKSGTPGTWKKIG
jgi:hypothetical protein